MFDNVLICDDSWLCLVLTYLCNNQIFILKVEAMLDKSICAMSSVFIGAPGSTFTEDILRLRKDWRLASKCDEYLCEGEEPNFIAEDE